MMISQYNTIKFKVKNARDTAVTLQSAMKKKQKTNESLSLVSNVQTHRDCNSYTGWAIKTWHFFLFISSPII